MGSSYFGGAGFPTWSLCVRAGACWSAKGGRVEPSQPTRGAKLSYTKSLSSTSTPSFLSSAPHFLAHRPTLFSLGAARLPCSRHKQIPKVSNTNPFLSESDREGWCLIPLVFLGVGILAPLSRAPAKAHARQMAPRADKRQTASAPPSRISCPF